MSKDRLRLDYEVNVDDDKVVDGIALAKELMADAMKNLAFYADGCSGCAHAMFGALAVMTAEEAEAATAKKGMASITWLLEGVTRDERKKAVQAASGADEREKGLAAGGGTEARGRFGAPLSIEGGLSLFISGYAKGSARSVYATACYRSRVKGRPSDGRGVFKDVQRGSVAAPAADGGSGDRCSQGWRSGDADAALRDRQ